MGRNPGKVDRIVLAYSGGLDTSVAVKWLQEQYSAEIVTLTLDVGQRDADLEAVRKGAAPGRGGGDLPGRKG